MGIIAKVHPFDKSLKEAQLWEQRVLREVANLLVVEAVKRASRQEQRDGIDFMVELRQGTFDVKFRDYKYYCGRDVLIETVSVVEDNVPGWFYTSKADAVVYLWWNESRRGLMPTACFVFIQDERLRSWFEENKRRYKTLRAKTEKEGRIYHTEFVIIPLEDFPKGTVKCLPFQAVKEEGKQLKLDDFAGA